MNDLYTQDRMARNSSDYEGCGIGEGRYSAAAERAEKIKDMQLPIVLMLVAIVYMVALVFWTVDEAGKISGCDKYVVDAHKDKNSVTLELPDRTYKKVTINNSDIVNGKVTVYYNPETKKEYVPYHMSVWVGTYAFGLLMIFLLLLWMKKILFKKKHAVERKVEHSYKDY
ncbi:MAG: hypothetical protein IJB96_02020 [Lachnospira sp.]|nr:hypothetical protein [Lachnospira sp.]